MVTYEEDKGCGDRRRGELGEQTHCEIRKVSLVDEWYNELLIRIICVRM